MTLTRIIKFPFICLLELFLLILFFCCFMILEVMLFIPDFVIAHIKFRRNFYITYHVKKEELRTRREEK